MITVAQFERMSEAKHAELINGRVVEKNGGGVCGYVGARIGRLLSQHVETLNAGYVFSTSAGYACFAHRQNSVRKPSVSFVKRGRFPNERIPQGLATVAPDLVVLVVAPDDTFEQIEDRVNDYLLAGVPLLWVANPDLRIVQEYRDDKLVRRLTAEDTVTGEPVLEGFRSQVANFFLPDRGD